MMWSLGLWVDEIVVARGNATDLNGISFSSALIALKQAS
jgi:hypothetical protein